MRFGPRITWFVNSNTVVLHDPPEVIDQRTVKEPQDMSPMPPTPPEAAPRVWPRWMDLETATKYISLSDKTLLRLRDEGKIWGKNIGKKWLIDRESLDAFMRSDTIFIEESLERLREVVR